MQLETIDVDKDLARALVREYREEHRRTGQREDAEIAKGYDHILRGRPLIRLSKVIAAGGLDDEGFPRLAVGRADQAWCYLQINDHPWGDARSTVHYVTAENRDRALRTGAWDRDVRIPIPLRPEPRSHVTLYDGRRSHVPVVPPGLRPRGRGGMHLYHVLWEVEKWERSPEPPADPALIRRVGGDLWAVYGMWDLTELERAVLAQRR